MRDKLVKMALKWEKKFGIAPPITSIVSEYDAAMLLGLSEAEYVVCMRGRTAVSRGADLVHRGIRYQIKANRPSGKKGSKVTWVPKVKNYEWDVLIWILYDENFIIQEARKWLVQKYENDFFNKPRLSPSDYKMGINLLVE